MSFRFVSYRLTFLLITVCIAFSTSLVSAQTSGTGSIQGVVTDPTGAVLNNAQVTATNNLTGVATQATTTDAGT